MEKNNWIVVNYTLPREPSRVRVAVWRKLKKIGAVNIQQSMWILPQNEENYRVLCEVRDEVLRNEGEAFVMRSQTEEASDTVITARFNDARDEEYREFLEQCGDFVHEIEKETARSNFTFAEVEENEEDLKKLNEWIQKILTRDFFGAPLKAEAETALAHCSDVLDAFCEKVYANNG
jgi:PaaX-like protein C-terminal domain.